MTLILRGGSSSTRLRWGRRRLTVAYVATLNGLAPVTVVLAVADPVAIMSVSGLVAAVHTPFIVALILAVNHRDLPDGLGPGRSITAAMGLSCLVYATVALLQLLG